MMIARFNPRRTIWYFAIALLSQSPVRTLIAQDTVSLSRLHADAIARDARSQTPALLRSASALRDRVITTDRFAQPQLNAQATHQSDVTEVPIRIPGSNIPTPPFTRYQLTLDLDQPLYDAGAVAARRAVERGRLGEAESDVALSLYKLRFDVNAALFTALLYQEQLDALDATRAVIDQRMLEATARVREGSALARDTSTIHAERLRTEETRAEAASRHRSALRVLSNLTGRHFDPRVRLVAPPVEVDSAPLAKQRPEFARFDAVRGRLELEARAAAVDARPRISAFMQAGVGQPGLNQLRPDTDLFYTAGVRATWRPLARHDASRRAEQARLQQRVTDLEERAFAESLERATFTDREDIAALEAAIVRDAQLTRVREEIEQVARLEFEEGAVTAAVWVAAQSDVLAAHIAARRHLVELAYARVRLLTTLGAPLP
jgi:outer membrane protein TolC